MRKSLFCLSFLMSMSCIHAQITKGNWLVGGTGEYKSYHRTWNLPSDIVKWNVTDLQLTADVGYFIADKIALGVRPSYIRSKDETTTGNGGYSDDRIFAIGPFGRYYFRNIEESINVVAEVGYSTSITKSKVSNLKGTSDILSIVAGPVFFINSCIGFELLAGYHKMNSTYINTLNKEGLQIKGGLQIHLER